MKRSGALKAIYDVPLRRGSRAITRQRGALVPSWVKIGEVTDAALDDALYVAATPGIAVVSAANINTVAIVDLSDPENPVVASSVSDASQTYVPQGIAIDGTNAFVAIPGFESRITTVSFATPNAAAIIGSKQDATNLSNALFPVIYDPGTLYVVVAGNEVSIWDASDPTDLQWVSTYDPGGVVSSQGGIAMYGDFIITTDPSTGDVFVYDASTPASPTQVGQLLDEGVGEPNEIVMQGPYGFIVDSAFEAIGVVDFSDPENPATVDSLSWDANPWDQLAPFGSSYVIASENSLDRMSAIDGHNPGAISSYRSLDVTGFGAIVDDIAVVGDLVLWVNGSDNYLGVSRISNFPV